MGEFILITGPMKSGKTKRLLDEYEKLKDEKRCIILKPGADTRFSINEVVSRAGTRLPAELLISSASIENYIDDYDVFFIDELQFVKAAERVIRYLIDLGKTVYATGLTLTDRRLPMLQIPNILCYVDELIVLRGDCDNCGGIGIGKYTFYNGKKDSTILIGDEHYMCLCPKCYRELSEKAIY